MASPVSQPSSPITLPVSKPNITTYKTYGPQTKEEQASPEQATSTEKQQRHLDEEVVSPVSQESPPTTHHVSQLMQAGMATQSYRTNTPTMKKEDIEEKRTVSQPSSTVTHTVSQSVPTTPPVSLASSQVTKHVCQRGP